MGAMAAKHVNQMAFCPPNPTYRKEDVNMWLDTDRGNRIPAFHIRRGFPLTVLVSHANAEDLGLVLQYWAYMSQQLQVDVFAYEYSGYGHATGRCLLESERLRPKETPPAQRAGTWVPQLLHPARRPCVPALPAPPSGPQPSGTAALQQRRRLGPWVVQAAGRQLTASRQLTAPPLLRCAARARRTCTRTRARR